jgi:hypothetical protein
MTEALKRLFSGQYTFSRLISQPELSYQGTATFEDTDSGKILYGERGVYSLSGKIQICYQNRVFVLNESSLHIHKEDNSLLHEFNLRNASKFPMELAHMHRCANDRYLITLTIYSYSHFSTRYFIKGPMKKYSIHTEFNRVQG